MSVYELACEGQDETVNRLTVGHNVWKRWTVTLSMGLCMALAGCSGASGGNGTPTPPAQAPTANAGGVYVVAPGTAVSFTSAGSTDPQGEALTFAWSFGDGTTGTGATVQHLYAQPAEYTATLTVTNTSGLSASASALVHVGEFPVANIGGPYSVSVEVPVTFNGSASTDPLGQQLNYAWTFGDGSTATGATVTHTYTSTGSFTATLKVTNTSGFANSASTTFSVGYPPPNIVINGPYTGRPGLPVQFTSAVGDYGLDFSFTYVWQFGDGTTSNVPNPVHTYANAGTYSVSLYAIGQYNESATATTTATITSSTAGPVVNGNVKSGSLPVIGAHVYLLAANTTGYGQPSVSLLSGTGASDSIGSYVVSSSSGAFTLPAGFNCPTHEQVYAYSAGGTIKGVANPGATLMTAIGACGYLTSGTSVVIDEATTLAAAYALSGYMTTPTSVSSPNTAAALTGIANGFLNAGNLVSTSTGQALASTPTGNGAAPQATINTLANTIYGCVLAGPGSSGCTTLFDNAQSGGVVGTPPTDTATAAINIAHHQGSGVQYLYLPEEGFLPYNPSLTAPPHDWSLPISFAGGYQSEGLAVDAAGDIWVLQYPTTYGTYPHLVELSSTGVVLQNEDTTCSTGNVGTPNAIAIAPGGNVFLLTTSGYTYLYYDPDGDTEEGSYSTAQYCVVSNSGAMLSPSGGYFLGGSENSSLSLYNLAVDANGNAWIPSNTLVEATTSGIANGYVNGNGPYGSSVALNGAGDFFVTSPQTNGIVELNPGGSVISPPNGFVGGGLSLPQSIALDNGGNEWVINSEYDYPNAGVSVSKFSSTGIPATGSPFTDAYMGVPYSIAIDGSGNVWLANGYNGITGANAVLELGPSGAPVMSFTHLNGLREYLDGPQSLALDESGDVWMSDGLSNTTTEFIGAATPVVTPMSANLAAPYMTPASKP